MSNLLTNELDINRSASGRLGETPQPRDTNTPVPRCHPEMWPAVYRTTVLGLPGNRELRSTSMIKPTLGGHADTEKNGRHSSRPAAADSRTIATQLA